MYKPKPIDTSHIELPKSLNKLIELLAENNHEIWAKQRMDDGWTHGQLRNDLEMKNPDLVPYDELFESEKDLDRKPVIETLKVIIALGYNIVKQ